MKAIELVRGNQIGWYGTAKLVVSAVQIKLNDVYITTNMNTVEKYHVSDDVTLIN